LLDVLSSKAWFLRVRFGPPPRVCQEKYIRELSVTPGSNRKSLPSTHILQHVEQNWLWLLSPTRWDTEIVNKIFRLSKPTDMDHSIHLKALDGTVSFLIESFSEEIYIFSRKTSVLKLSTQRVKSKELWNVAQQT
jgi:hypothetical protein